MTRRILTVLLAASMLANQAICHAHTHKGMSLAEFAEHAQHPHFHLHDHDHVHHEHTQHNHRPATSESTKDTAESELRHVTVVPTFDHEADAVYLPGPATLACQRISPGGEFSKAVIHAVLLLTAEEGHEQLRATHPPPPAAFVWSCPIYLRILSLRI
jgi:hypothetical protein